jgi:hypothetical protein
MSFWKRAAHLARIIVCTSRTTPLLPLHHPKLLANRSLKMHYPSRTHYQKPFAYTSLSAEAAQGNSKRLTLIISPNFFTLSQEPAHAEFKPVKLTDLTKPEIDQLYDQLTGLITLEIMSTAGNA